MHADKTYCMSSFLMFRTIADRSRCFSADAIPRFYEERWERTPVYNSEQLLRELRGQMEQMTGGGKAALALSGGIDSAILAKMMPKGSVAYTFRCHVPGMEVTNEVPQAAIYAKACGLEHRVIDVEWEDHERLSPILMRHKGAPIHSIEVQICKAAQQAKADGFSALIFGESADANFGGHDGLLSRDWTMDEFVERYAYVLPQQVLREPMLITQPFEQYVHGGMVAVHDFMRHEYYAESMGSYQNACEVAGIDFFAPYAHTCLGGDLDYARVRGGESKYLVREVFAGLYPHLTAPKKIPMPRPMNEWLRDWEGPKRPEFLPGCADGMTGDRKWLVWALERYLNLIDGE